MSSVTALDRVTFSIRQGRVCAVIGPNGAGKSTLFRVLTGLTTPSAGRVSVLGMDPAIKGHQVRRDLGFMPAEERSLFLRHTGRENLLFHGRLQGIGESMLKQRIDEVLQIVGLWEGRDRAGFALSSGMRARLMLARAILHEPRVLILDEPTGAIDPIGAHDFLSLIMKITIEQNTATLISSHRLEEIDALRDNVLLLDRGRLVLWGDLNNVKGIAGQRICEIACTDSAAARQVLKTVRDRLDSGIPVRQEGSLVLFPVSEEPDRDIARLKNLGIEIDSVSLRKLSLRETISALLEESSR